MDHKCHVVCPKGHRSSRAVTKSNRHVHTIGMEQQTYGFPARDHSGLLGRTSSLEPGEKREEKM